MHVLPVVEAAYKYKDKQIREGDFYRAVMAHPTWWVQADDVDHGVALGALAGDEGHFLDIFSSRDLIPAFEAREGELEFALKSFPGFVLFGMFEDALFERINVDTHNPHAFHFFAHQLPLLRAWAKVVAVELALSEPDRLPDPFAVLRRFREYYVVMHADEAPTLDGADVEGSLVFAPDPSRQLAAVFTAPDRVDPFVRHANENWQGHFWSVLYEGEHLFRMLKALPLDGIVFNPLTDGPTVALQAAVLDKLVVETMPT